jgi:K+-sensing histidine kinase KdpD
LAVPRYGLAILSVSCALGVALFLDRFHFRNIEVPLFLFALALSAWYGGAGAAVLSVFLSAAAFDYFFTEPLHTLVISRADPPYFVAFASFASLVAWFAAVRRRVELDLRQARDNLQIEVAERTQQASLLNLTHDTIFVRDMDDVITYWNRGAQELFGWTAVEAVGKNANLLLKTVYARRHCSGRMFPGFLH